MPGNETIVNSEHTADHLVRFIRPSPSIFAYCKHSKTRGGEDLGNEGRPKYVYPKKLVWQRVVFVRWKGQGIHFVLGLRHVPSGNQCITRFIVHEYPKLSMNVLLHDVTQNPQVLGTSLGI